eukprot:1068848-Amphidinium_carterae.1
MGCHSGESFGHNCKVSYNLYIESLRPGQGSGCKDGLPLVIGMMLQCFTHMAQNVWVAHQEQLEQWMLKQISLPLMSG